MSSSQANKSKAELHYYEAFVRLKENEPKVLLKGSKVSQNNVAKEAAGVAPSALRKSRYPELISEIQSWLDENPQPSEQNKKDRVKSDQIVHLKQRIAVLIAQRDEATSKLLEAQLKLIDMANKISRLTR